MEEHKIQVYDRYKDSGVEWLGEIPEHWEVKKLKFLINGKLRYGANESGIDYDIDLPRYVRITDFGLNGKLSEKNKLSLTWNNGKDYLLKDGDILFARSGATVGKTYQFKKSMSIEKHYSYAGYLIKAEANENIILSDYLYLYTNSDVFNKWKESIFIKATIENIGADKYAQLKITLPPLSEQTKIAEFLDDKTTKIDEAIRIKEKQIALLKERKQILIHKAVTRGLDKNVTLKNSGVEWIGDIPEHWEVKPIKYLGKIINGYAFNSSEFKDKGVRVMKISNIQTMRIDWSDESFVDNKYYQDLPQFRINENDLVFALTRPIISTGIKASIVNTTKDKILLNQRNAVLKPSKSLFKKWIYFVILDTLFTQSFDREIDKTGQQPNISTNSIGNIKIPFPLLSEQKEISAYIESASEKIETAIDLKQQEIARLKEYKSSLINGVVTGKVKIL